MELNEIFEEEGVLNVALFGSRAVGCAKENSDYDYLVLVKERPCTNSSWFDIYGFRPDVDNPLYGIDFSSWRKGNINLVFTNSPKHFKATLEASEFCKKYKVFDKVDRCRVHEAFRTQRENEWPF